ncbi:DUF1016 N-terminal domain-containing protein [Sphingobacterium sp. UBA3549]|uniref:DUF1016 N-terminal domain-containing protein n=1 Tax=Sphingobacterium sp. UBA3549 TaxID=1947496 RepID=UPI0039C99B83
MKESQSKAIKAVNTELMNLYWHIRKYISAWIEISEWGQSVVKELIGSFSLNSTNLN